MLRPSVKVPRVDFSLNFSCPIRVRKTRNVVRNRLRAPAKGTTALSRGEDEAWDRFATLRFDSLPALPPAPMPAASSSNDGDAPPAPDQSRSRPQKQDAAAWAASVLFSHFFPVQDEAAFGPRAEPEAATSARGRSRQGQRRCRGGAAVARVDRARPRGSAPPQDASSSRESSSSSESSISSVTGADVGVVDLHENADCDTYVDLLSSAESSDDLFVVNRLLAESAVVGDGGDHERFPVIDDSAAAGASPQEPLAAAGRQLALASVSGRRDAGQPARVYVPVIDPAVAEGDDEEPPAPFHRLAAAAVDGSEYARRVKCEGPIQLADRKSSDKARVGSQRLRGRVGARARPGVLLQAQASTVARETSKREQQRAPGRAAARGRPVRRQQTQGPPGRARRLRRSSSSSNEGHHANVPRTDKEWQMPLRWIFGADGGHANGSESSAAIDSDGGSGSGHGQGAANQASAEDGSDCDVRRAVLDPLNPQSPLT